LWHGSGLDILDKICTSGFLRDYNNTHAFGKGVYFARDANYSINPRYAVPNVTTGRQYMLFCRVICGEYVKGQQDFLRPPQKNNAYEYETMVDVCLDPSIIVACNDHQAYPTLLLEIEKS